MPAGIHLKTTGCSRSSRSTPSIASASLPSWFRLVDSHYIVVADSACWSHVIVASPEVSAYDSAVSSHQASDTRSQLSATAGLRASADPRRRIEARWGLGQNLIATTGSSNLLSLKSYTAIV